MDVELAMALWIAFIKKLAELEKQNELIAQD